MKEIQLTQGKIALIDDEDFEEINKYRWCYSNNGYAVRNKNGKIILMHNIIMKDKLIDHIDGNKLNNQKSNLRKCTNQQNQMNRKKSKNCTSRFKGVYFNKKSNKWMSRLILNKETIFLGEFKTEEDSAKAYDSKARELFGEFARCNFDENGNEIIEYIKKTEENKELTNKETKGFTSKYKGVSYSKTSNKWHAQICYNYKHIHLGFFKSEIEAAKEYNKYIIKYKLDRKLNFIGEEL